MDIAAAHARIQGRVQGVGYRYFALEKAQALKLAGWVRNNPDGSVEAHAEGPREALEVWIEQLRRGPWMARVTHLDIDWPPAQNTFDGFGIR